MEPSFNGHINKTVPKPQRALPKQWEDYMDQNIRELAVSLCFLLKLEATQINSHQLSD